MHVRVTKALFDFLNCRVKLNLGIGPGDISDELLRILWREQHPQGTEQYALDYSTALITHQTGSLFA
jgi:hypothetical protein